MALSPEDKADLTKAIAEAISGSIPSQGWQQRPPLTSDQIDAMALAAAADAGVKSPSTISDTATATTETLGLDTQVLNARIHSLEALVHYLFDNIYRGADKAEIVKQYDESKKGSEVLDPSAKRGR